MILVARSPFRGIGVASHRGGEPRTRTLHAGTPARSAIKRSRALAVIVLAIPLLLAGTGVAISVFLSADGLTIPDPNSNPELTVTLATEVSSDDIQKIKRNVKSMLDEGASKQDVDAYLTALGVTAEDLRHVPLADGDPAFRLLAGPPTRVEVDTGPIRVFAIHPLDLAAGKVSAEAMTNVQLGSPSENSGCNLATFTSGENPNG